MRSFLVRDIRCQIVTAMITKRQDMSRDDDGPENSRAPLLISVSELATILKCSTRTIWRLDSAGSLPPPVRFGGQVRWRYQEIIDWINQGCPPSGSVSRGR